MPIDQAAEAYVRLVLALGERDSDSLDMYRGPSAWRDAARARHVPLDTVRGDAEEQLRALERGPSDDIRRAFLVRQLRAVAARVDILKGERPSFADETKRLFDFSIDPHASTATSEIYRDLDRLLPGSGSLPARYAAFDRRYLVSSDRVPAVMRSAIDACRAVTLQHATLPAGERVELQFAHDIPWSAYTRYLGGFVSRIVVNADLPLTVDRALDLACHETYPGHHLIYSLLEARYRSERAELLVQPLFSPQSMLHESAASVAPLLAFPDAARGAFERDALFPMAHLDPSEADRYVQVSRLIDGLYLEEGRVIGEYLNGRLDFPRASAALERDALMPGADATLKFANQFRSYAATYTLGRDAFERRIGVEWNAYLRVVSDPMQRLPTLEPATNRP